MPQPLAEACNAALAGPMRFGGPGYYTPRGLARLGSPRQPWRYGNTNSITPAAGAAGQVECHISLVYAVLRLQGRMRERDGRRGLAALVCLVSTPWLHRCMERGRGCTRGRRFPRVSSFRVWWARRGPCFLIRGECSLAPESSRSTLRQLLFFTAGYCRCG